MIGKVLLVRTRYETDFIDELSEAINHMQADGYDVEVQYSRTDNYHSALLIGRLTQ